MTKEERTEFVKAIQRRIGTPDDGAWGPLSIAACQKHLRALMPDLGLPDGTQAELRRYYGPPGNAKKLETIDVRPFGVEYFGKPVSTIRVHPRATDLLGIVEDIAESEFSWILKKYKGTYENRPTRGGSVPSTHAYGIAIDLWSTENRNKAHWPLASSMPIEVMEIFAKHGWTPAGAFWHRDAMHFQRTKP
jgi:hypothetical protein